MASAARAVLVLIFVGLGACFDPPDIPEGLQCSRFDDCPPNQRCFDGVCYVSDPNSMLAGADAGPVEEALRCQSELEPILAPEESP